jgi:hypothetical protein
MNTLHFGSIIRLKSGIFITLLSLHSFSCHGQNLSASIASFSECSGEILLPVMVENGNDIAAISMVIIFDPVNMNFIECSKMHPAFQSGLAVFNAREDEIRFSWVSTKGYSFISDTLFLLEFTALPGTYSISWDTSPGNCEFTNANNEILACDFQNSNIRFGPQVVQLMQPGNAVNNLEGPVDFTWMTSDCPGNYDLQIATDPLFTKIIINESRLTNPNYTFGEALANTQYFWRCRATADTFTGTWSQSNSFTTKAENPAVGLSSFEPENFLVHTNLEMGFIHYQVQVSSPVNGRMSLYSISGKQVFSSSFQTESWFTIDQPIQGESGIYLLETMIDAGNSRFRKVQKLCKTD